MTSLQNKFKHIISTGFIRKGIQGVLDVVTTQNVNIADARGRTPLMLACYANDFHAAQVLTYIGAYPEVADADGQTALDYCTMSGAIGIGQYLMDSCLPVYDCAGDIIYPFSDCTHPINNKYLDFERKSLICTHCAVVLEEKMVLPATKEEQMEYCEHLGINNNLAYSLGIKNSLRTKKSRAIQWLAERVKNREMEQPAKDIRIMQKHLDQPFHPIFNF